MSGTARDLESTFYGHAADIYDRFATIPVIRTWRKRTVETLELSPGETVVEMGCGTGANFPYLREHVGKTGQVIGVDVVSGMLRRARRRVEQAGWKNVEVVRGDATQPPITSADALVSTFVVGMLSSPGAVVRSWIGFVRPGGRVTLLNATRSDRLSMRPLNLACRLFVRFTAPGYQFRLDSPVKRLEARWERATEALFEETVDHVDERMGGGFVTLASGRVVDERGVHNEM